MTAQAPVLRQHGNAYNIFILVLTIFSLAIMVLLLLPLSQAERDLPTLYDNAVCVIFLIDFAINLAGARPKRAYFVSQRGWLDLLGSIPDVRLHPVHRPVPACPPEPAGSHHAACCEARPGRTSCLSVIKNRSQYATFITILLAGRTTRRCEHPRPANSSSTGGRTPASRTGGEAIWWGIVTITTVGYGDYFPTTMFGRITGVFVMFAGIGIIGALASILASLLVSPASPDEPITETPAPDLPEVDGVSMEAIVGELAGLRAEIVGQRAEHRRAAVRARE